MDGKSKTCRRNWVVAFFVVLQRLSLSIASNLGAGKNLSLAKIDFESDCHATPSPWSEILASNISGELILSQTNIFSVPFAMQQPMYFAL